MERRERERERERETGRHRARQKRRRATEPRRGSRVPGRGRYHDPAARGDAGVCFIREQTRHRGRLLGAVPGGVHGALRALGEHSVRPRGVVAGAVPGDHRADAHVVHASVGVRCGGRVRRGSPRPRRGRGPGVLPQAHRRLLRRARGRAARGRRGKERTGRSGRRRRRISGDAPFASAPRRRRRRRASASIPLVTGLRDVPREPPAPAGDPRKRLHAQSALEARVAFLRGLGRGPRCEGVCQRAGRVGAAARRRHARRRPEQVRAGVREPPVAGRRHEREVRDSGHALRGPRRGGARAARDRKRRVPRYTRGGVRR
mmetsp:Transcript_14824/g.62556  ORF Transcript_14824/g.62556 Transcript_14824/m.62556 type:complete len:317 (+) Transcript_14824:2018-2968(+)